MFFRPAVLLNAASRAASVSAVSRQAAFRATPAVLTRLYTTGGVPRENVESRVLDIVKGFDKVDASKVNDIHDIIYGWGIWTYSCMIYIYRLPTLPTLSTTSVWTAWMLLKL